VLTAALLYSTRATRYAALIPALGNMGRMRLAADMAQLEMALSVFELFTQRRRHTVCFFHNKVKGQRGKGGGGRRGGKRKDTFICPRIQLSPFFLFFFFFFFLPCRYKTLLRLCASFVEQVQIEEVILDRPHHAVLGESPARLLESRPPSFVSPMCRSCLFSSFLMTSYPTASLPCVKGHCQETFFPPFPVIDLTTRFLFRLVLHHLFSRAQGAMQSPHQLKKWSVEKFDPSSIKKKKKKKKTCALPVQVVLTVCQWRVRYSRWLDQHSESEALALIRGTLDGYAAAVKVVLLRGGAIGGREGEQLFSHFLKRQELNARFKSHALSFSQSIFIPLKLHVLFFFFFFISDLPTFFLPISLQERGGKHFHEAYPLMVDLVRRGLESSV
jgi:hypothetical protein